MKLNVTFQENDTVFEPGMIEEQVISVIPLDSPIFTGTPTAPTAPTSTNTNQLATTAFVHAVISDELAGYGNIVMLNITEVTS